MWHAVVHEIHNGTLLVCVQHGDDWEHARQLASFTELQQEEDPQGVERELTRARDESARLNAEDQRREFDQMLRRP